MLHIIATPIGNLEDITLRSLRILKEVDGIICEDTRHTGILLSRYEIKKPMTVLNDYNESRTVEVIIAKLKSGENLALVSDAGTPLISDPGYKLVRECIKEGIEVDSLPGPSSVIAALTLSGMPPDKFMFLGFPPDKIGHRQELFKNLKGINDIVKTTFVFFVAPFKLVKTLQELEAALGSDIHITLAKELTKIHQEVKTMSVSDWQIEFSRKYPKGEWVMIVNI